MQTYRLLIIEDNPDHLELLQLSLERIEELLCDSADSLQDTEEKLSRNSYDLVLADMNLPDGNILDFMQRSQEEPKPPYIIMTAYGDEYRAVSAMKAGAVDYFVKSADLMFEIDGFILKHLEKITAGREQQEAKLELGRYRERSHRQQQSLLQTATSEALHNGDTLAFAAEVTECAATALLCSRAAVLFYESRGERLECIDLFTLKEQHHESGHHIRSDLFEDLSSQLADRQLIEFQHHPEKRLKEMPECFSKQCTAGLCAGIRHRNTNIGFLFLEQLDHPRSWSHDENVFAAQLADQLALAWHNRMQQEYEEELRRSEENYRLLFEETAQPTLVYRNNLVADANRAALRLFDLEYKAQILGAAPEEFSPPLQPDGIPSKEKAELLIAKAFAEGSARFNWLNRTASEKPLWCDIILTPLPDRQTFHCTFNDITEAVQTREQLEHFHNERTVLLKELFHRTKNNMQLINAMLAQQEFGTGDASTARMLSAIQSRINTMALVHEQLYHSKDLSRINLKQYIEAVLEDTLRRHSLEPEAFQTETEIEPLTLLIDSAIPFGLILNELISNAVKFCKSGSERPQIRLSCHSLPSGQFELTVADNGTTVKSPEQLLEQRKTGLHTIELLAEKQLKGEWEVAVENGVAWKILFQPSTQQRV